MVVTNHRNRVRFPVIDLGVVGIYRLDYCTFYQLLFVVGYFLSRFSTYVINQLRNKLPSGFLRNTRQPMFTSLATLNFVNIKPYVGTPFTKTHVFAATNNFATFRCAFQATKITSSNTQPSDQYILSYLPDLSGKTNISIYAKLEQLFLILIVW